MGKGRRTLNKAKDYFEDNGWLVDECEQGGKYRRYKDAFAGYCINCWERPDKDEECCGDMDRFSGFDLMAVKDGRCVLSQIKTNKPATQRGFKAFAKVFASSQVEVWVMTWYDYKDFRIQKYKTDGSIEELDLR